MQSLFLPYCLSQGLGKQEVHLRSCFVSGILSFTSCPEKHVPIKQLRLSRLKFVEHRCANERREKKVYTNLREHLVTCWGVTIVGSLDTQFPSVGPNPPISLREREQRRGERRHCGSRQCSKKRSVQYQIEVAARQWLPFTGSFTHGLHTALSNASFFFTSPSLFSSPSLSFSHVRLSSSHHRGMGDNEILTHPGCSRACCEE